MGLKNFARSLRPGDDRQLADELRRKAEEAERRRRERVRADARVIADRDARRTPAEVAASKARGHRAKRGRFEPPAPGINP
jgi:hypothetical protein